MKRTTNLVSLTSKNYFLYENEKIVLVVLFPAPWDSMESGNVQSTPCLSVSLSSGDSNEGNSVSLRFLLHQVPSHITNATKQQFYCNFWNFIFDYEFASGPPDPGFHQQAQTETDDEQYCIDCGTSMMKLFPIKRGINQIFQNFRTLTTNLSKLAMTVTLLNVLAKKRSSCVLQ